MTRIDTTFGLLNHTHTQLKKVVYFYFKVSSSKPYYSAQYTVSVGLVAMQCRSGAQHAVHKPSEPSVTALISRIHAFKF